jgi:hypothetical protein
MGDLEFSRMQFYSIGPDGLFRLRCRVLYLRDILYRLAPVMNPHELVGEGGPVRSAIDKIVKELGLPPIKFTVGPPHREWTISYGMDYPEVYKIEFRPEMIALFKPYRRARNLMWSLFQAIVRYFVRHYNSESFNVYRADAFQDEVEEVLGLEGWLECLGEEASARS